MSGQCKKLMCWILAVMPEVLVAGFDDNFSLSPPNLLVENFLDIKAYEFQFEQERSWQQATNGIRISGGSLNKTQLYIQSGFKLNQKISRKIHAHVWMNQQNFYDTSPTPAPTTGISIRMLEAFEAMLFGTPEYDKRKADLGWSVRFGNTLDKQIHFSYRSMDHYYNRKNSQDRSFYMRDPNQWEINWHYRFSNGAHSQFHVEKTKSFLFQFDNMDQFGYADQTIDYRLEYPLKQNYLHLKYYAFNIHKFLTKTLDLNQSLGSSLEQPLIDDTGQQNIDYHSIDISLEFFKNNQHKLTAGLRYDQFASHMLRQQNLLFNEKIAIDSKQIFMIVKHPIQHSELNFGLHVGYINQNRTSPSNSTELKTDSWQAKLRNSYTIFSPNKHHWLMFTFSINLDKIDTDPADGGGIMYQSVFP